MVTLTIDCTATPSVSIPVTSGAVTATDLPPPPTTFQQLWAPTSSGVSVAYPTFTTVVANGTKTVVPTWYTTYVTNGTFSVLSTATDTSYSGGPIAYPTYTTVVDNGTTTVVPTYYTTYLTNGTQPTSTDADCSGVPLRTRHSLPIRLMALRSCSAFVSGPAGPTVVTNGTTFVVSATPTSRHVKHTITPGSTITASTIITGGSAIIVGAPTTSVTPTITYTVAVCPATSIVIQN
ncbi:hypothetical protein BDQ17DRAFT_1433219 [Cyathus striatus]|nr:hypothetical protein BDQ17DRAFT_1433219 [Cyathus striatus]